MAISSGYKQQCPSCEHLVPIKDESLVGKKIDCPKCKFRFAVEPPKSAAPPKDAETSEEKKPTKKLTASPAAKTPAKAGEASKNGDSKDAKGKPKAKPLPKADADDGDDKPKKKKKKGGNTSLMIGAGIGVLALVLLTVAYFMFFDDSGSSPTPSNNNNNNNQQANNNNNNTNNNNQGNPMGENPMGENPMGENPMGDGNNAPKEKEKEKENSNLKDITNLLPEDTYTVLTFDLPKINRTPVGEVLFDRNSGANEFFRNAMGFNLGSIKKVIQASNPVEKWEFWIVRLTTPIKIDDLQSVMKLEPQQPIKGRNWFLTKEMPILKMIDEYVASVMKERAGYDIPPIKHDQFAVNLLDSQTLIVGDRVPVEKFLKADAQPKFRTQLATAPPEPKREGEEGENPMGPMGSIPMGMMGSPMGFTPPRGPMGVTGPGSGGPGGAPMGPMGISGPGVGGPPMGMMGTPMGPMGISGPGSGGPGGSGGNQPTPVFTNNTSYRTIDPKLKFMMNELDPKNQAVLALATKVPGGTVIPNLDLFNPLPKGKEKEKLPKGPGVGKDDLPDDTKFGMIGVVIDKCDPTGCNFGILVEMQTDAQAKEVADFLRLVLPFVASELSTALGVEIGTGAPAQNPNGMGGEGYPGGLGSPDGPMGPGGLGGPGGPRGPGGLGAPPTPTPGGPGGLKSDRSRGVNGSNAELYQGVVPPPPPSGPGGPGGFMGAPVGPMGPGGGFPNGPGGMNPNSNQNPNQPTSFLTVNNRGQFLVIDGKLDWKEVYQTNIAPPMRAIVQIEKGKGMMASGLSNWHNLAVAVKRMREDGERKGTPLPQGALPRPGDPARFNMPYPADQRLSWMVELLPYLGYDQFYRQIDKSQAWNFDSKEGSNLRVGSYLIAEFLNPKTASNSWKASLQSLQGNSVSSTHFVGLSGIGMDSPYLLDKPENAKKLGLFGFDRVVKWDEITDKPEETIFCIQVPPDLKRPWIRGGGATVQGIPETESFKSFVTVHADGKSGAFAIMADGSIRFIKSNIPDATFHALVTYKGGEKITNLDEFTELVPVRGTQLKSRPPVTGTTLEPKREVNVSAPKKEEPAKTETPAKKEEEK
jgi:hypothetical protein